MRIGWGEGWGPPPTLPGPQSERGSGGSPSVPQPAPAHPVPGSGSNVNHATCMRVCCARLGIENNAEFMSSSTRLLSREPVRADAYAGVAGFVCAQGAVGMHMLRPMLLHVPAVQLACS